MKRYDLINGQAIEHPCGRWVYYETDVVQLQQELSLAEEGLANYAQELERLNHRCNALAYLHYGHYLVRRTRESVQADIEACESALTALRTELATLQQKP